MASSRIRKHLSYPRRLFLWLLAYSLLLTGCFIFFQYHREKEFKTSDVNSRLQLINRFIISQLAEGKDIHEISRMEFKPFEGLRISLFDKSGHPLYDNYPDSLPHLDHSGRAEIRDAMSRGSGYAVYRHSESTGENYFYSATRSPEGMIVRTAAPHTLSLDSLLKADYGFLRIMGIVSIAMCVLGYFATRRIGQNILRLNSFARKVERGEKISGMEPFPHDELGEISSHIVRLYAGLQQANADRLREHRNALHEQQEKERVKKRLTNNINHELKTPVASIRICLETLLTHPDLDENKREEFLRRSLTHCDRLGKLLADVSLITRMSDGDMAIIMEPHDAAAIIREAVADKETTAQARGIRIDNRVDTQLMVNGNASLLLSVFNNLIDNAVAYSGGSLIEISAVNADGRETVISFADNGCGVPAEHLEHIFERFYRIDKGRSRAAGGTGLGLAIVKNAVTLHGGSITVANRPSGGLLFRIRIPLLPAQDSDQATKGQE